MRWRAEIAGRCTDLHGIMRQFFDMPHLADAPPGDADHVDARKTHWRAPRPASGKGPHVDAVVARGQDMMKVHREVGDLHAKLGDHALQRVASGRLPGDRHVIDDVDGIVRIDQLHPPAAPDLLDLLAQQPPGQRGRH